MAQATINDLKVTIEQLSDVGRGVAAIDPMTDDERVAAEATRQLLIEAQTELTLTGKALADAQLQLEDERQKVAELETSHQVSTAAFGYVVCVLKYLLQF